MKHSVLLPAIFLATSALSCLRADVIVYNNGAPNHLNGNEMTEWIQAENFTLASTTTITDVHFWALELPGFVYSGSITWQIYSNTGTQPGTLLTSGNVVVSPVATGTTVGGGQEVTVDFNITPFVATGGTVYWLGLHNGPLTDTTRHEFYWETTSATNPPPGSEQIAPFGGTNWLSNGAEHAFYLTGTTVPEPVSVVLLGTLVLGLAFKMRKGSAKV